MNNVITKERRQRKNLEIRKLVDKAKDICFSYFHEDYRYSIDEAQEELGLDCELTEELVKDYVSQIIKATIVFQEQIFALQNKLDAKGKLDYTELRELAHKNLGVARNLRIKDAEQLLYDLMKKDDLEYLFRCVEVLRACAIKLSPICAYNTIKVIEVKSTF